MENIIRFRHAVNSGDVIATLAGIRKVCLSTGKKAIIYQQIDMPGNYYPGATHPIKDDSGAMVTMNRKTFEMLKPLVEAQTYIESFEEFTGQDIDVDLNKFRGEVSVNMPYGPIQNWVACCFPDMQADLTQQWIHLVPTNASEVRFTGVVPFTDTKGRVIINFTDRYRSDGIHYFFLKKYEKKLVFAGTKDEHRNFTAKWNLDISYLHVENFLQLAIAIKHAAFLLGNQSMCWNIAEAMKSPRIVEYCPWAPNCFAGIGKDSLGFFHQGGVEYAVDYLYNKYIQDAK